jgi:hypothetical protein
MQKGQEVLNFLLVHINIDLLNQFIIFWLMNINR